MESLACRLSRLDKKRLGHSHHNLPRLEVRNFQNPGRDRARMHLKDSGQTTYSRRLLWERQLRDIWKLESCYLTDVAKWPCGRDSYKAVEDHVESFAEVIRIMREGSSLTSLSYMLPSS